MHADCLPQASTALRHAACPPTCSLLGTCISWPHACSLLPDPQSSQCSQKGSWNRNARDLSKPRAAAHRWPLQPCQMLHGPSARLYRLDTGGQAVNIVRAAAAGIVMPPGHMPLVHCHSFSWCCSVGRGCGIKPQSKALDAGIPCLQAPGCFSSTASLLGWSDKPWGQPIAAA